MTRILVVNNDPDLRNLMVGALERVGHRVAAAQDGLEALGKIYTEQYDLVVLDVALPYIDGNGLLDVIRKRSPETIVVIASGRNDSATVLQAIRKGAYDFIEKPVGEEELLRVVTMALQEGRMMQHSGYIYKDHRRGEKLLFSKGMVRAVRDSLLAGLTFLAAFIIYLYVLKMSPSLSIGLRELTKLSLGMTFCYSFVLVARRGYRFHRREHTRVPVRQVWTNITQAYLVFIAVLFLSGNMNMLLGRIGVILGYGLGILSIIGVRFIGVPTVFFRSRREGKKTITIVGSGKAALQDTPLTFGRVDNLAASRQSEKEHLPDKRRRIETRIIAGRKDADELIINAGEFSAPEVLDLLDRYQGRNLKIVVVGGPVETGNQTDRTT